MARHFLSKIIILIVSVTILVTFLLGLYALVTSPYVPPSKIGICRHELSSIRGILLNFENHNGVTFLKMAEEDNKVQPLSLNRYMSECCLQFSAKNGKPIFHTKTIHDETLIVDPWGNAYNVDCFGVLDESLKVDVLMRILSIGNYIVWSSGPNGTNERGGGDDVFAIKPKFYANETADKGL